MSTSIYDQIFMAECTWDTSNNGHFDLSEPRVLGEANGLLALMDSNFTTGNSALTGTVEVTRNPNTEFVHEVLRSKYVNDICVGCNHNRSDQPAYSCAWNAVHSQDFNENYIWCEDYKSSKCFKSENREDRGIFCLNYGAEFDQNVFGAHTSSNREKSNGFLKDQSVSQANNICENLSEQALQNELGLICSNVGGISNVGFGSDFSNFTVRCMHENSMNSTIGRPCDGISFNQYDEMEMNGRLLAYNTENVISELLNADMTASIEPLEFEGTRGIATVSLNELDGFDDQMPLIASNKTEIYSDEQSPQKVCLPEKDSDKKLPMKTAGSQLALPNNDGNHEENGSRSERVLVKNDNGTMITLTTGERESSNVKPLACGESEGKGQPAKNLLAERRRRKRLNERLCILRSVVPTITKMDRTSILRDTIEYTKQLLHQIRSLHGELEPQTEWPAHLRAYEGYFRPAVIDLDQKFVDKSIPKLEVERSCSQDLNIHMTCQTNPTILLSTIGTVESFGFDIEQGIISCYSDFGMQVHCSESVKDKSMNIRPEDIRLALLQTGGYFGKN